MRWKQERKDCEMDRNKGSRHVLSGSQERRGATTSRIDKLEEENQKKGE